MFKLAVKKIKGMALITLDILMHSIAIKRYCKKNHFEPWISIAQVKILTKENARKVMFLRAKLSWSLKPKGQKYSFITITSNLFIAILCKRVSNIFRKCSFLLC